MNNKFTDIELIEQYCNAQLQGEQLAAFEQRLQTDAALLKEVEFFQDMMKGITLYGDEQLKKNIATTHQTLEAEDFFRQQNISKTEKEARIFNIRRVLAIAASLSLLILAGLYLFSKEDRPSNQVILAEYGGKIAAEKTQILIEDIKSYGFAATDKGKRDSLANALEKYKTSEYENARVLLADYITRYPDDQIAKYYIGLSFFELGDYSRALRYLQPLSIEAGFEEQQGAEWYTALTYLLIETDSAEVSGKKLLEKMSKDIESPYQQDAAAMLVWFK